VSDVSNFLIDDGWVNLAYVVASVLFIYMVTHRMLDMFKGKR
jgi:hypothetical protein